MLAVVLRHVLLERVAAPSIGSLVARHSLPAMENQVSSPSRAHRATHAQIGMERCHGGGHWDMVVDVYRGLLPFGVFISLFGQRL